MIPYYPCTDPHSVPLLCYRLMAWQLSKYCCLRTESWDLVEGGEERRGGFCKHLSVVFPSLSDCSCFTVPAYFISNISWNQVSSGQITRQLPSQSKHQSIIIQWQLLSILTAWNVNLIQPLYFFLKVHILPCYKCNPLKTDMQINIGILKYWNLDFFQLLYLYHTYSY